MKRFTKKENQVLSEIYRRLNYFHKGNVNASLIYLGFPSQAKVIAKYGLIRPYSSETPRVLNWYSLTEKGKQFFLNYVTKGQLTENMNEVLFDGTYIKEFDYSLLIRL